MQYSLVGELPKHQYVWVDSRFTHQVATGYLPAVWYGLVSYPGRVWGCTVMLECGAIYRNIPAHALSFSAEPKEINWSEKYAQTWDCYGTDFSTIEYKYLSGLTCKARCNQEDFLGCYLFTVAPIGDGYSAYPEQAKEFMFVRLDNDRLTIQPTNRLLFDERSFTQNKNMEWPKGLQRQQEIWSAED